MIILQSFIVVFTILIVDFRPRILESCGAVEGGVGGVAEEVAGALKLHVRRGGERDDGGFGVNCNIANGVGI